MANGFTSSYRIVLLATTVFLAFAGLGTRLVWLHVIDRDELLRSVEEERQQVIVQDARRGDILGLNGVLLATSRPVVVLGVDPQVLRPEDESKWPQLAALAGLPLERLRTIFETKFRPAPVAAAVARTGAGSGATLSRAEAAARCEITMDLTPAPGSMAAPPLASRPVRGAAAVALSAETAADRDGAFDESAIPLESAGPGGVLPGNFAGSPRLANPPGFANSAEPAELGEPDAQGNRPIRWAKLSDEISETTDAEIKKLNIRGVYGHRAFRRVYPHNDLAAHLIGYVDREERPIVGMERYADFFLRGQNGWVESEKDGKSREMAQFRSREISASDGYSVVLSIDATVQQMVEDELAQIAKQYSPLKATIVVSDPRDGFILALANYPTFDLNEYNRLARGDQRRMRNVAVADQYEPGSVFKIVAAAGALNEGLVNIDSKFDCSIDKIEYKGIVRNLPREDKSDHFDKPIPVATIITHSSNRGAAQLAMLLGDRRFYNYARAFGFGQLTGFPVGGEMPGTLRPPEKWDSLTITRMPMGQSVGATVLQMHQAMGVIASGGILLRPQIIREIRDPQGAVVYRFERSEMRRVISEATARTMAHLLMDVASTQGNAPEAAIPGYEVAGKTGTAQKLEPVTLPSGRVELRYSEHHHVASFLGFFPASRPRVAISVVIDDADARTPGGVAYGAKVAAPVFKRLGERLISYLPDVARPPNDGTAAPLALGSADAWSGGRVTTLAKAGKIAQ